MNHAPGLGPLIWRRLCVVQYGERARYWDSPPYPRRKVAGKRATHPRGAPASWEYYRRLDWMNQGGGWTP